MPRTVTREQRIFVLKRWWISGTTSQTVDVTFQNKFPSEEVSTSRTMSRLGKKFDETGSIEDAPRSNRPVTVRTEENRRLTFHSNPRTSQNDESRDLTYKLTTSYERSEFKTLQTKIITSLK